MMIVDVRWHSYRVPFKAPFSTAHGVLKVRAGIIVEVQTEEGVIGVGEIAPLPEFGRMMGADTDAINLVPTTVAASLKGRTLYEALSIVAMTTGAINLAPTTCGMEIALLDAIGKVEHRSVGSLLCEDVVGAQFIAPTARPRRGGGGEAGWWGPLRSPYLGEKKPSMQISPIQGDRKGPHHLASPPPPLRGRAASPIVKTSVPINAVIGAVSQDMAVVAARQAVASGYACIKLKVGMAQDVQEEVERVAAVRAAIGPERQLRLDANEAWDVERALAVLLRCVPYHIEYVEQPVKADNLEAMRMLCRAVPIPIAADEAISDLDSVRCVLENEAAAVLIIKPQLAGGLRVGQQIMQEAAQHGVKCVITSSLETGIGIAAALHLAAATPTITKACGLSTLTMLVDDLLMEGLPIQDGYMTVPTGDGLGVTLDRDALEIYKG